MDNGFNSWTNWTVLYGVIPRPLCKIRLNDVSEMFNCWERRWIHVDGASHTLSTIAAIFSGVCIVFSFSRFGLSMRMPSFFHFFHKIMNIRNWWRFSSSKISTRFSQYVLQHYQSNVTIFPSVVQAYIQNHIRSAEG